jgi:hypothetical protein
VDQLVLLDYVDLLEQMVPLEHKVFQVFKDLLVHKDRQDRLEVLKETLEF